MPLLWVDIAKPCLAALLGGPAPEQVRAHFECKGTRIMNAKVVKILLKSSAFDSVTPLGPVQSE
jgi:hypothetical protein